MKLCIIPARGGSKRIPRKNLAPIQGTPLIAISIQNAIKAKIFDDVIVSSDDDEILSIARDFGAKTPFIRPEKLSDDFAITADVISHAINECEKIFNKTYSSVCCLYATAPLINDEILQNAYKEFIKHDSQFLLSVCEFAYPIQRALKLDKKSQISMFNSDFELSRSQDLEPSFHDAGAFYFGKKEAWLNKLALFAPHSKGFLLPRHRVCDIDNMQDLEFARMLFKIINEA